MRVPTSTGAGHAVAGHDSPSSLVRKRASPRPPIVYRRALADEICARLAMGEGLATICRDDHMPNESSVRQWVIDDSHEDFATRYARARELQADAMVDQILTIADGSDDPHNKRVRIDARKWLAGKIRPKAYGDKIDLAVSNSRDLRTLSDEQLDARIAALLANPGGA